VCEDVIQFLRRKCRGLALAHAADQWRRQPQRAVPNKPPICSYLRLGSRIGNKNRQKLLSTGKTDLLDGFISKRGRPFSAYLKLEDGKVGFEFPEKTTEAARH